jgi:hypothetical protein
MVFYRKTPRCIACGEVIAKAIHKDKKIVGELFFGDTFERWEYFDHKCGGKMSLNYYEVISEESEDERKARVEKMTEESKEKRDDIYSFNRLLIAEAIKADRYAPVIKLMEIEIARAESRAAIKAIKDLIKSHKEHMYKHLSGELYKSLDDLALDMIKELEKEAEGE